MDLSAIQTLLKSDLLAVNKIISTELHSDISMIAEIGQHLINSGGKRLRPMLVLLSARAGNIQDITRAQHLAAIVEFIHTATLLHDDVVDASMLRRGVDTANAIWGNSAPVLVGDFVYSRCFQMMTKLNDLRIMRILADTTNRIAEGEVLQLLRRHQSNTTLEDYLKVIRYKTATLFSAACELGGLVAGQNDTTLAALAHYGDNLGIAYQLVDDALDYSGHDIGKNLGDDLAEGKMTLPLIHALATGDKTQVANIKACIKQGDASALPAMQAIIQDTDSLNYTRKVAADYTHQAMEAIQALPPNPYQAALINLAQFVLQRQR